MNKDICQIAAAMALATALGGTSAHAADKIVIGAPNWFAGEVVGGILQSVIEDNTSYEADVIVSTNPEIFDGIKANDGSYHIHADAWLPTHDNFIADAISNGSARMTGRPYLGRVGFCTPKYTADALGLKSMADLKKPEIADQLKAMDFDGNGKMDLWVGGDGWSMTAAGTVKIRDYGLGQNYEPYVVSEGDIENVLYEAFANREHIVFACYEPQSWFAMEYINVLDEPEFNQANYKLVMPSEDDNWLEKSRITVGNKGDEVGVVYTSQLESSHPEVAKILSNIDLNVDDLTEFFFIVKLKGIELDYAVDDWIAANESRVKGWMSN